MGCKAQGADCHARLKRGRGGWGIMTERPLCHAVVDSPTAAIPLPTLSGRRSVSKFRLGLCSCSVGMRPCLRPVDAALPCAAGHDALSADPQVPTNCTRLIAPGRKWVLLGSSVPSSGSLRQPVSCSCQPLEGRSSLCGRRFAVTLAAGHQRPGDPADLVGQRDRRDTRMPAA